MEVIEYVVYYSALFVCSSAITYAIWTRVRVILLRQSILEIRQGLFLAALDHRAFQDPGYVATRRHLNLLAETANHLSMANMVYLHRHLKLFSIDEAVMAESPEMQSHLDGAYVCSAKVVHRYLWNCTSSGWRLRLARVLHLPVGALGPELVRQVAERTKKEKQTRVTGKVSKGYASPLSIDEVITIIQSGVVKNVVVRRNSHMKGPGGAAVREA
ncbi:MAG: hypothetical protein HONBIEJF_02544 [Fimbriimonadaceae bacterium]|nr:hypothetical protein [Fimbriimonadaceae bacterium]